MDDLSAAEARRALDKILNEKAALRKEVERLSEVSKDTSEQVSSRAQHELLEDLTLQVQQLHLENKMLRDQKKSRSPQEVPQHPDRTRPNLDEVDEDPFVNLLGEYLSRKDNENIMKKAGVTAQRKRSNSRRKSMRRQEPRQSIPAAGAPDGMASEVVDVAKLYLSALFREKKFRKIIELLEVLDEKGQFHNGGSMTHMVKEGLCTYLRSQDFQTNPNKLVSRLQEVGCSYAPKLMLSSSYHKRHSAPASIVEKSNAESTQARPLSIHVPLLERCPHFRGVL